MNFNNLTIDVQCYIAEHETNHAVLKEIASTACEYDPLVMMMERDDIGKGYDELAKTIVNRTKPFTGRSDADLVVGADIVLQTIAEHVYFVQNTDTLTALVKSSCDDVRIALARSGDLITTPNSIQLMLAEDKNMDVLLGIALESNYDQAIALAYHNGDEDVKATAIFNDFVPASIIQEHIDTLSEHISCADDCFYLMRECEKAVTSLVYRTEEIDEQAESRMLLYDKLRDLAGEKAEEYVLENDVER